MTIFNVLLWFAQEMGYEESNSIRESVVFFFPVSGGCDQSVCVVKWAVECLFKLVVSCSEVPADQ